MRPILLFSLFVLFAHTTNAQLTLLPQLGFENSRTSVEYNELASFSPATKVAPQVALRLDYKFKKAHGPYIGVATSRAVTKVNFSHPETAMNAYTTSKGNTQLRLEGGYQVSTKPIYFKKSGSSNSSKTSYQKNTVKKSCGSYFAKSSCGSKANKAVSAKSVDKGSWVRIQPSLGVAYIPSTPAAEISTKSQGTQTSYQYNAGNWNTALVSGLGFEFGRNKTSKFNVSINYVKGIGNLDKQSITTLTGNKSTTTSFESEASGWNVRMGIPVSLNKKKPVAVKKQMIEKMKSPKILNPYKEEKKCGQYKMQYKPRCSRII